MNDKFKKEMDKARYSEFNIEEKSKDVPNWYTDLDTEEKYVYDNLEDMIKEYGLCIQTYPEKTKEYLCEMMVDFMELMGTLSE